MRVNKLTITSQTGHFGKVLGYDDRNTYDVPPPSTVIGILQTIYNRDIDNFVFGYTFQSDIKFKDDITIHKRNNKGRIKKKDQYVSDIKFIELHHNCKLTIYTDIQQDIKIDYMLCMGRAGNIARLYLPIQEIELIDKDGQGFNQFTPINIGTGRIKPYNIKSYYMKEFNSYEHQVSKLRFNKVFNYNKNYDEKEQQNIFLWEVREGEVKPYND